MTTPLYAIDRHVYRPIITVTAEHERDGRAAMYLAAWLNYRFGHGTVHGTHIRKFLASSEYASEEFEAEGAFLAAWSAAEIDSAQRRGPRLMGDIT